MHIIRVKLSAFLHLTLQFLKCLKIMYYKMLPVYKWKKVFMMLGLETCIAVCARIRHHYLFKTK